MVVRTSGGKHLEILEPGALVGLPIEVDVYDGGNPATMLATIERAQDAALQVQLSELGAGRFAIARSDPKATDAILAKGNLVKIKTGGVYRGAWWIEEPETILTSTDEAAGELVKVAGRGALAYLERAIVYPPVWPTAPTAYRSSSSAANATGGATTIVIPKPSGTASGDVLVAAVTLVGGTTKGYVTPPLGWKSLRRVNNGTAIGVAYFRKQAASSEPASYQFVFQNSTQAVGQIIALQNASADYTQWGWADAQAATGTSITNPSVDVPTVDGILLTFASSTAGSGMTPPAGMTEIQDHNGATGRKLETAYLANPALGPTGDKLTTNTTTGAWIGTSLVVPSTATLEAVFEGETPGAILATLIDRAQARTAMIDLTYDFSGTADSQGQPWPDTFDLSFHVGTSLLDVWRQLVALGMEGEMAHDLKLSAYVDRSRDKTGDVILRKGYHLLGNVANLGHLSGLRTRLLVEGAGGRVIEVGPSASEADPKIARREGYLAMATSDSATDLSRAGSKSLEYAQLEDDARSLPVTHGLLSAGRYEPWEDYRPGDVIGLDAAGTGVYTEERIVGITVAQAGPLDYSVSLALNSVVLEAMIRMRRELDALSGTGSKSSGGSSLGLGGGGATGGGASSGLVAATTGDTPGYLSDKLVVSPKMTKALGGIAGNRQVELDINVPALGTGTPDGTLFLRDDGVWSAAGGGGAGVVDYSEDNSQINASSSQALLTRTVTLAAGTYLCVGKAWIWSSGVGTLLLRKGGVQIGGTDDPRNVTGNRILFATFVHTGGSVTIEIYHSQESGTTQYGASGDPRFGRELQIISIGGTGAGDAAWTAPTFAGAWTNYGSGYNPCGYRKDAGGFVHLRGLITGGASGTTIFTLPAGYRPSGQCLFGQNASQALGRVDVQANGVVICQVNNGTGWITLEGIVFMAEA